MRTTQFQNSKMPWCIAVDCNNNTFKSNRDKNVSFYGLPKDENLKMATKYKEGKSAKGKEDMPSAF